LVSTTKKVQELDYELDDDTPKIEYNDFAERAYKKYWKVTDKGINKGLFEIPDNVNWQERRFLEEVDTDKGPIVRTVTKVVRLRDKMGNEWFYWHEDWTGVNSIGNPIGIVPSHVEGFYMEVQSEKILNEKGTKVIGRKPKAPILKYYIPWDKDHKTLDEVVAKANRHRDAIIYLVKVNDTLRCGSYSYEQFANLSFLELVSLARQKGGPQMTPYVSTK